MTGKDRASLFPTIIIFGNFTYSLPSLGSIDSSAVEGECFKPKVIVETVSTLLLILLISGIGGDIGRNRRDMKAIRVREPKAEACLKG